MNFKEWLQESQSSLLAPSTGRGGGTYDDDRDDDGEDGDEGWDWDKMERRRWNILKWCGETESMKEIMRSVSKIIEAHRGKKTTYRVLRSQYKGPRYVLQLNTSFDVDMSPMDAMIRGALEKSDLYKPLGIEENDLYKTLENDDVREYVKYVICLHLSSHPASSSPFTQSHFAIRTSSILSNNFAFKVWYELKRKWQSSILPKISEIAIAARSQVERPSSWMDVGKPEVSADLDKTKIHAPSTVYDQGNDKMLASVIAMIPFDWNLMNK